MQVHSYVVMPGDRTAYLSELKSGMEVLVVSSAGAQRVAIVGRVKIETRPLVGQLLGCLPADIYLVECLSGKKYSFM